jgi:hypothetical protein
MTDFKKNENILKAKEEEIERSEINASQIINGLRDGT